MKPAIATLKITLTDNLVRLRYLDDPLEKLVNILNQVDETLLAMGNILKADDFQNIEEEIDFFKYLKPEILSIRMEEGLKYNLILNKPIGTKESQLRYFEEELKVLQSFFRMNPFYYQYYRNKFSELDRLFFVRNAGQLAVPIADVLIPSPTEFSTPMTYLFSKFRAYENAQYFILGEMAELQNAGTQRTTASFGENLRWTGDSINVVELAYGLWLTGQLNEGNASLNQIVRWLETNLQISIANPQKRFDEIVRRKRLSHTRFLDQMKENILSKIEDQNN